MSLHEKSSDAGSSHDVYLRSNVRTIHLLDAARAGTTVLALLMGIAVLGVTANSLQVYNETHVADVAWLSLWPSTATATLDIRPTVALATGAAILILANLVALASHHRMVRSSVAHTPLTVSAPLVGLIAAIVAIAFFYVVNRSITADTVLSWSCRWRELVLTPGNGATHPHFGTLCDTSHAGVYLAILLLPVEALAFSLAVWQWKAARNTMAYTDATRSTPSPLLT